MNDETEQLELFPNQIIVQTDMFGNPVAIDLEQQEDKWLRKELSQKYKSKWKSKFRKSSKG